MANDKLVTLVLRDDERIFGSIIISPEDFANPGDPNNQARFEFLNEEWRTKVGVTQSLLSEHLLTILRNMSSSCDLQSQALSSHLVLLCSQQKRVWIQRNSDLVRPCLLLPGFSIKSFVSHNSLEHVSKNVSSLIGVFVVNKETKKTVKILRNFTLNVFNEVETDNVILFAYGDRKETETVNLENVLKIFVKTLKGTTLEMFFFLCETVESFIGRLAFHAGLPLVQIRLIAKGHQMETTKLMSDYIKYPESTIYMVLRLRGGHALFLPVNLDNPRICLAVAKRGNMDGFCNGLNFVSHCRNYNCTLRNVEQYTRKSFPELLIIVDSKTGSKCRECEEILLIDTFLVHKARVKFAFRKTGQRSNPKAFEIENSGDRVYNDNKDEYHTTYTILKTCNSSIPEWHSYDFIAICTVGIEFSFNKCQKCGREIKLIEEVKATCGRAFHQKCLENHSSCDICSATQYSLAKFQEIVGSTASHAATIDVSNQTFGNCFSSLKFEPRPLSNFLQNVSPNRPRSSVLDRQSEFVISRLPELIKNTTVSTLVLAQLRQQSVLSEDDEAKLTAIQTSTMQARQLYRIIPTRVGGIEALVKALEENNQSGAVLILKEFLQG